MSAIVAPAEVAPPATPIAVPTIVSAREAPNVTGIRPKPTTATTPPIMDVEAPAILHIRYHCSTA